MHITILIIHRFLIFRSFVCAIFFLVVSDFSCVERRSHVSSGQIEAIKYRDEVKFYPYTDLERE